LIRRGSIRPATIATAARRASGASGLVGVPPAPPPVCGRPLTVARLGAWLDELAWLNPLVLPEL
jgi:hypothetical protein